MTEGYEDPTRENMLAEVALRRGTVKEWGGELALPEIVWVIYERVTEHLDMTTFSMSDTDRALIRKVAAAEEQRQTVLIGQWKTHQVLLARERKFQNTWEPVARLLVAALKHPDDPRSDGEVIAKALEAFRLLDRHIDNRINRHDPFRPIG